VASIGRLDIPVQRLAWRDPDELARRIRALSALQWPVAEAIA
jgi:hypothetical protein